MELRLEKVTKRYQETEAVSCFSYVMEKGVYGLLGQNGAGKTTLMRSICTLMKPEEGRISWNGEDIFSLDKQYRKVLGYLPQEFGYYPDFTIEDYLLYIASLKGIERQRAKRRTEEMLTLVGMEKEKRKKMKKLSGGMKRRIGIAQAMLNNPKILVLDEPTAGLDPNERIRFRNLISKFAQDRLVLLSTHIVSDVESIAGQVLLMKEGKLVASGTVPQLIAGMEEKVFSLTVSQEEAEQYSRKYPVANRKTTSGGVRLRILAQEAPSREAVEEEVTLEEVFLNCFGEKAGELHDSF